MSDSFQYSYPRYLTAKKPVDARALNRRVWEAFLDHSVEPEELRILEVGGGVGATVERVVSALDERSVRAIDYTFVDVTPENLEKAKSSLRDWGERQGFTVHGNDEQVWKGRAVEVSIEFLRADVFTLPSILTPKSYDGIIAQAVLDLLPIADVLQTLRPLLRHGGLWYLPLHYDGVTALEPSVDPLLDMTIERLYHESMSGEEGRTGARSGRELLIQLPDHDAHLVEAGASDWVVFPRAGEYPGDEAYFLHHILHFIETELMGDPALPEDAFTAWIDQRRRQVEAGELVYVAHQLDVLAKQEASAAS